MKKILSAIALAVGMAAASAMPVTSGAGVTINTVGVGETGTLTLNSWAHSGVPSMTLEVQSPGGGSTSAGVGGINATFVGASLFGTVESFVAYCIEIFTSASRFGTGAAMERFAAVAPQVSQLFAYSANLNLAAVGLVHGGAAMTDSVARSAGLQLALWELIYDDTPGSLVGGKFSVAGGGATGVNAIAWGNTLLAGFGTFTDFSTSLTVYTDVNVGNKMYQDFITATRTTGFGCCNEIPEPGTLALAGLGLLGAGIVGNRRRKTQA